MLRTAAATATAVRGRAYDDVAHQQAAMPEQLLTLPGRQPEHDDRDPEAGRREATDLTALRALRESRRGVEALDPTAERLRHPQDAFTEAADASRARADRYAEQGDAAHPMPWGVPAMTGIHSTETRSPGVDGIAWECATLTGRCRASTRCAPAAFPPDHGPCQDIPGGQDVKRVHES